jgi:glutamine amidotransferase
MEGFMCRLAAYLGKEILIETVLIKPVNSLVKQSLQSREQDYYTNGDGFGLGWYNHDISPEPGFFKSLYPAWNDENLLHLSSKIQSSCFFGHVRAASTGGVTHNNCHPFVHDNWMFMHNGGVHDFIKIKRHIRHLLDDDIYNWIQGDTDSEHLFAVFRQMAKGRDLSDFNEVVKLITEALQALNEIIDRYGTPGTSYLNVCVTDGKRLIASRYCTDKRYKPESMHYAVGNHFELKNERYHMIRAKGKPECVLVASEMLNDFSEEWQDVPAHHLLLIDEDLSIQLYPLP